MSVPHGTLLDYNYNSAHEDHIHIEGVKKFTGTPPTSNPGMSDGVKVIYKALNQRFGQGYYFLDSNGRYVGNDPGVGWTHMGGYVRRKIAGKTTWSQHSWWNALDIGPYIREDQDIFINFLKGSDDMALTPNQEKTVEQLDAAVREVGSNGGFPKYIIPDIRKNIVTMDELEAALKAIQTGNVDSYARDLAKRNAAKLAAIKEAL